MGTEEKIISFNIEVKPKLISIYNISHLYKCFQRYIDDIYEHSDILKVNTVFKEGENCSFSETYNILDGINFYNLHSTNVNEWGESLDSDRNTKNISKKRRNKFRKKFYNEKNFESFIKSIPKYNSRSPSLTETYIKDYLIKNRSSKLRDIMNGCQEQGLRKKSDNSMTRYYLRLEQMVKDGYVTKDGNIYVWNYKEDDE